MSALPSVFGFGVESDVPLRFLRSGGAESSLAISLGDGGLEQPQSGLIGEWPLHGSAVPASAALYEMPWGYEYWTTDAGRFAIDLAGARIEVPPMDDEILREQRLYGMPMLLSFAHRGDFSLHGAAVEVDGRAVILAGPSKFGKTTLALAFHRAGFRLLSEDLVCVRPGDLSLLPGPAVVRLRPDVYEGVPPDGTEVVAERPDRVFLRLLPGRAGSSAPVPIGGVFFLREGPILRVEPAPVTEAVKDLWHLGYRMPATEGRADSFKQLTRLASGILVWNVHRPFTLEALGESVDVIVETLRQC